ncbi:hypothetical protein CQ10_41305 [Bradyrhizobium valentinum]|uniref:Uncharacterized protein n=1 Tax=Bradyrhizobium valentinum TaxID=1518501 RepID=A0A0R3LVQ0_9BRAD|nr:hypothetical protein CP49_18830 [Bradyrhizobium valentinum]KRR09149.1 hypothetical protein CQ10_41305 [Bradyrhizobium valentinum]
MLPIGSSACLFDVAGSQEDIDSGWFEGDITVTRAIDGTINADRIVLPNPTYESTLRGFQKHCIWAKLLDDTRRYFASTKLGLFEAEPHDVESIFKCDTGRRQRVYWRPVDL